MDGLPRITREAVCSFQNCLFTILQCHNSHNSLSALHHYRHPLQVRCWHAAATVSAPPLPVRAQWLPLGGWLYLYKVNVRRVPSGAQSKVLSSPPGPLHGDTPSVTTSCCTKKCVHSPRFSSVASPSVRPRKVRGLLCVHVRAVLPLWSWLWSERPRGT